MAQGEVVMRIYISGQISGRKTYRDDFSNAQTLLSIAYPYATILNPVLIAQANGLCDTNATWADFMLADLSELAGCTHIYFLNSWNVSFGAIIEWLFARRCGIKTIGVGDIGHLSHTDFSDIIRQLDSFTQDT
jgi:hypothetical protein